MNRLLSYLTTAAAVAAALPSYASKPPTGAEALAAVSKSLVQTAKAQGGTAAHALPGLVFESLDVNQCYFQSEGAFICHVDFHLTPEWQARTDAVVVGEAWLFRNVSGEWLGRPY